MLVQRREWPVYRQLSERLFDEEVLARCAGLQVVRGRCALLRANSVIALRRRRRYDGRSKRRAARIELDDVVEWRQYQHRRRRRAGCNYRDRCRCRGRYFLGRSTSSTELVNVTLVILGK